MIEIIMPQVGQDIPTATIVEWLKSEGDSIEKGEVIVIVESDKATFEVEAEADGTLTNILFEEGSEVEVFKPIAYIDGPGRSLPEPDTTASNGEHNKPSDETYLATAARTQTEPVATLTSLGRPRSSPAARRLAREQGIDLMMIRGTGISGRILFADVQDAVEARERTRQTPSHPVAPSDPEVPTIPAKSLAKKEDTIVPLTSMRKTIAARMTQSVQTIPHFYAYMDVDMTEAMAWRRIFNAAGGVKVTITDLVVKACAMALQEMPDFNAFIEPERIIRKQRINVGVATAIEGGLMVPVIPDADVKTLQEIAIVSRNNTEAARRGQMDLDHPATFTVTSLGMYGIRGFLPIINPPQCAILAVGAVEERVVPISGGIGVRSIMTLTLGADHRAVDGKGAADFLQHVRFSLTNLPDVVQNWVET